MNVKKLIDALNIAYGWIDYASDFFKEKYGWADDDKDIQQAIKEVEALQTASCQNCKWLDEDEVCTNPDSVMFENLPHCDMMCIKWYRRRPNGN